MYPAELVVIGVHSAKFPSEQLTQNIRNAVMRHGIQHPVVNDAGLKIWSSYAVRAWPTLIIVDPRGRIAGEISGEILANDLAVTIDEIIRDQADLIDRTPFLARKEASLEPDHLLRYPSRLLPVGPDLLYIADTGLNRIIETRLSADHRTADVLRVFGSGIPGLRDGTPDQARLNSPHGMAYSPLEHKLFVADTENHAIRKINLEDGGVTTVAGTGQKAHGRYAITSPTETPLRSPWSLLLVDRYLFIAMAGSHQIWVLVGDDQIGPFAGSGAEALVDGTLGECGFNQPSDITEGFGHLIVADPEASAVRAISLGEQARTITLVGQGLFDFGDQDGIGDQVLLQHPTGVACGSETIYIADTYNHKIKTLDPRTGEVQTMLGSGVAGMADGEFAKASLYEPEGVSLSGDYLFIADTNNHQVRVANLVEKKIHTLKLTHVDRLSGPPEVSEDRPGLPGIDVMPGKVEFSLEFQLPAGTHINPDAPSTVTIQPENKVIPITQPTVNWTMNLAADKMLTIQYVLYYCEEMDARICMSAFDSLRQPVRVTTTGRKQASIRVDIMESAG